MEFKDYYSVLGVAKTASDDEIKRAYRKLARKYHPDLNQGDRSAETRFKEINEANEVLGDPDKRRKYDELGANWRDHEHQPPRGQGGGWAPGGGATYRTVSPEEMQDIFGGESFSDFFQTFFGGQTHAGSGGRQTRTAPSRQGAHVEAATELTLEEAFSGTTRRAAFSRNGKEHQVEVRIPAGVKDGATVRAAGEGGAAPQGGKAGDLYLVVRVLPHARFERRGQDLHTRVSVPVTTAVLGGEIAVDTLSGSTLRLKIPEQTTAGRVFRLRGHGMPAVGAADQRGDLYATVDIQIPAVLTAEQRKHYEALRELEAGRSERT